MNHLINDLIDPKMLKSDFLKLAKHREICVYFVDLFVAVFVGFNQAGLFKAVEFNADGVGTFVKFLGEATQIGTALRVEEEPEEEFDAGFGLDYGVEQICESYSSNRRGRGGLSLARAKTGAQGTL